MTKEPEILNKRIWLDLMKMVPDMAAMSLHILSRRPLFSLYQIEGRSRFESSFATLIKCLIEALETGKHNTLERQVFRLISIYGLKDTPILFYIEPLRVCRDVVMEQLQKHANQLAATPEDYVRYANIRLSLYEIFDHLLHRILVLFPQSRFQVTTESYKSSELLTSEKSPADLILHGVVQLIMQSNEMAVLMIDHRMNILEMNPLFAQMFGVDRDKIRGRNVDEAIRLDENERYIQWVIERGETGHYLMEYRGKWLTISTCTIDYEDRLYGAIAVVRNLADYQQNEEELTRSEALASVGQLAAGMAHEIRNPLTSIKGFIQLLREQEDHRFRDSYYSVILMEVERINELLNDVLVLARYRDSHFVSEPFAVMDELYSVVRLLEPEANRRGIRLEVEAPKGNWQVKGHPARIKQVFLNLLKNALEAIHSGGQVILIQVRELGKYVIFTIEDDGPGLSEEIKKNLFIPFYTTKAEGTGLGLSMTQRIIADHGGRISADNSARLGGARFEVRLPLYH